MKIALHTFISIKNVFCFFFTSDSNLPSFDYSKKKKASIPGKTRFVEMDRWMWQKSSRQIWSSIHILQLVLSRRRCLIWMIIRSSDSTISFSVVVKVSAYHPSDPCSTPARVIFYIFFIWFYGPSRWFHSFWADPFVRWGDEPREKPPDHPRVERLVPHVTRARLESSAVRCS